MSKKANPQTRVSGDIILDSMMEGIARLYNNHRQEIRKVIDESKDKFVKLNFGVNLDESKSAAEVKIGIRFSSSVTDVVNFTVDSNQGTFTEIIAEVDGKPAVGPDTDDEGTQSEDE